MDEASSTVWFRYPLIKDPALLSDNRAQAIAIETGVQSRLIKDGQLEAYNEVMRDYIERGVFKELSQEEMATLMGHKPANEEKGVKRKESIDQKGQEMDQFRKALQTLKEKMENAEKELKEKEENDKVPAPPIKVEPKVESEPDFDKYYEIFKNPEMTDKEEMGQFTSLIKEKRSALVKQLVVQMSVDPAVTGKSMIFKTPSKEFAEDIKKKEAETTL